MNNVFLLTRKTFSFKPQVIKKLLANQPNKDIITLIDNFDENKFTNPLQCANLVRQLLAKTASKQAIQKLLHLVVYFSTLIETDELIKILQSIQAIKISPLILVKFYSIVFKSVNDNKVKKWLISSTLSEMQKQQKTTPFISFVENFKLIVGTLQLQPHELIDLYWKLINYLQKHLIYKKLISHYVFIALNHVHQTSKSSEIISKLLIKAIQSENFQDDVTEVLNKQLLKSHPLYPVLEARITGDITAINSITVWQQYKLNKQKISRKVKIEAIPRVFKNIKQASYSQAAQMLGIEKKQVQGYIIEAVRLGIIKAKLDEYQQTIIINKLNIRCLQKGQQVQLQKQISDLCQSLDNLA